MPANPHHGVRVRVEDDGSVATLILCADADPAMLNVDALLQVIRDHHVAYNESLSATLSEAVAAMKTRSTEMELVIAKCLPPIHGKDGSMEWMPGCNPKAATGVVAGSHAAKVDYYNQTRYVAVKAGMTIGRHIAPIAGCDGVDVLGKPRKARQGSPFPMKTDKSIAIDAEGIMTALVDGILHFSEGILKVQPLFEVPASVDFSTGNIFFTGSVVVKGDICDRFIVHASQDLTVQGLIGAATIICGRHLNASCGMAAHDRGCLFIAADAMVGYLKNVHGVVHGNLVARSELLNCDLAVGRNVVCESGAIIGGAVAVGETVLIGTLGSAKGTTTTMTFGSHPCRNQIEILLRTGFVSEQSGHDSQQKTDPQIANVVAQIRACAQLSCEYSPGKSRPVNLTVQKLLHPGVIIKTGRCRVRIDQTVRGPVHIHGDENTGLYYRCADGVSHPLTDLDQSFKKAG